MWKGERINVSKDLFELNVKDMTAYDVVVDAFGAWGGGRASVAQ